MQHWCMHLAFNWCCRYFAFTITINRFWYLARAGFPCYDWLIYHPRQIHCTGNFRLTNELSSMGPCTKGAIVNGAKAFPSFPCQFGFMASYWCLSLFPPLPFPSRNQSLTTSYVNRGCRQKLVWHSSSYLSIPLYHVLLAITVTAKNLLVLIAIAMPAVLLYHILWGYP